MSYRFSDTEKWEDAWYLSLDNDSRAVYQWLIDNCNHAGIIKKEFRLLNYCCRTTHDSESIKTIFGDKLLDCGDFFILTNFLKHQYPSGLTSEKPAVKSVRNILLHASKRSPILKRWLGDEAPFIKDKA